MPIKSILDKLATFLVLAVFAFGMIEVTDITNTNTPILENMLAAVEESDPGYLWNAVKLGWGWSAITVTFPVDQLPSYLQWYGSYYMVFMPDGYLAIPGFEIFILIGISILLIAVIGWVLQWRSKSKDFPKKVWLLLPVIILITYPVWVFFNYQLYLSGAEGVLGITKEEAHQIYLSVGQHMEPFSWFFLLMTVLGVYKGGRWGKKAKVF